jgi:hypothetical protein
MSEKIAVHCKTEEEWTKSMIKAGADKRGWTWYGAKNKSEHYYVIPSEKDWKRGHSLEGDEAIISAEDYLKEGENEVFKVGDRVECIDDGTFNSCENYDKSVVKGNIYTVSKLYGVDRCELKETGNYTPFFGRFKLAAEETHDHISDALTYGMGMRQVNINDIYKEETMRKSIEDNFEKTKEANLVEAELPGSKLTEFVNDHLVKIYSKEILAEAKRLKKEREEA